MCQKKRIKTSELIEGVDFNWEVVDGIKIRVFSKEYLINIRTKCCETFCKNCPWGYKKTKNGKKNIKKTSYKNGLNKNKTN